MLKEQAVSVPQPVMRIVHPFPPTPRLVQQVLDDLVRLHDRYGRRGPAPAGTPLPWDPPTCEPELRRAVWEWCDEVVTWINTDCVWRPAEVVPDCWLRHPHIANEVPVLACQRALAGTTLTPDAHEDWLRYSLPAFLQRLADRLGNEGCRRGEHDDWSAETRVIRAGSPARVQARRGLIALDVGDAVIPLDRSGRTSSTS